MQRARLARILRCLLMCGLGISAMSCGSDAQNAAGPVAGEAVRKDYQQKKAAAAERAGSIKGAVGKGKFHAKPGS